MVKVIHNAVAGRRRYKITGLYRREGLKEHLERELIVNGEIRSVSASTVTGTLLVLFDPRVNPFRIKELVRELVLQYSADIAESLDEWEKAARKKASLHVTVLGFFRQLRSESPAKVRDKEPRRPKVPLQEGVAVAVPTSTPWHLMSREEVLAEIESSVEGLTEEGIARSVSRFGRNEVPQPEMRSKLAMFLGQFNSVPVWMLGVGAALSLVSGGMADAVAIMVVVVINAIIGFATEDDAERTINSLKELVSPSAVVMRAGEAARIRAEDVCVGDILVLRPGEYVPADARLVEASHLTADESVLTGESLPAEKTVDVLQGNDIPLGSRSNMVYGGTLITGGQGLAAVVEIGKSSEIGRIQSLVSEATAPATPVEKQLDRVGNQLVVLSSVVCGVVFLVGLLRGTGFVEMLKTAISLAVAAVPEGLPAVATTTLALGIKDMRRHKVLFRNLDAVCTIGSVQTICLDKTGTLTLNRMEVTQVVCGMQVMAFNEAGFRSETERSINPFANEELLRTIHIAVLCNESDVDYRDGRHVINGSPTENALVQMAITVGVDVREVRSKYPRQETRYRAESRLYMSTLHGSGENGTFVAMKGSPFEVLSKCEYHIKNGEKQTLCEDDRSWIESQNENLAGGGSRVLGVAYGIRHDNGNNDSSVEMVWLGLIGMADPIREGVRESMQAFHRAGLNTVMITGDQSATAYAVGTELGLNNGRPLKILDSEDLGSSDPELMKSLCADVNVFARVSPSHKLQIVQSLQSTGRVVAMTGDGINDGPALKAADVGIAMGRGGTDLARDVADVVLEQDDLETLIVALSDGRTIYNNIRKTLHYLLATNLSEILVMFVAGALGLGHPLNAMQLLWINLVSDIFPGLALAMEPPEPDVLRQPPRDPDEPIVRRGDYSRIAFEGTAITFSSLAAYGYGLLTCGRGATAGTVAFQSLTTSQILHALSCRSDKPTIFGPNALQPNKYLTLAVFGSLGIQFITQLVPPLRRLLGLAPLGVVDAAVVGAASVVPLLITEMSKNPGRLTSRNQRSQQPRSYGTAIDGG